MNGAVEFDVRYSLPGGEVFGDAAAALAAGLGDPRARRALAPVVREARPGVVSVTALG